MDSGPVATFQVHEYLRPKVNIISRFCVHFQFAYTRRIQPSLETFFLWFLIFYSSVIYMKMTQFSTSSNVVWVEMDCAWPLVHTGIYSLFRGFISYCGLMLVLIVPCLFYVPPAIFFVYLVVLLEAMKQQLWKLVKIRWGIVIDNDGILVIFDWNIKSKKQ